MVSAETRAVVEEASAVRDKELQAWARSLGVSRTSYAVSQLRVFPSSPAFRQPDGDIGVLHENMVFLSY